jgi:PmbA protein
MSKELFAIAEAAARSRGVRNIEVIFERTNEALTRFANNAIHQNVAEIDHAISIRVSEDRRTARVSTNRLHRDSIEAAVEQAIALTRASNPDESLPDLAESAATPRLDRGHASTAAATPAMRAAGVADAIRIVEDAGQIAAGMFETFESTESIFNSRGVAVEHNGTLARFSITAMAADSSGWAKASSADVDEIDPRALAARAMAKARDSRNPREIPHGRYTVILEPAAVLDLVGLMTGDFSATALADKRSCLTERLHTQLFGKNIDIVDDASHPLQTGAPFDGEGIPRTFLRLVEAGVPKEIAVSRSAALKSNLVPTGHGFPLPNEVGEAPMNIVIGGGSSTIDDMIRSTERGILITRLWYIREVDPYEKIMTGMTRDGTFLIERGELVCGLRNFRFNQSIIEMLNNVETMSPAVRASGEEAIDMVVPAMKVHNFHLSGVTKF